MSEELLCLKHLDNSTLDKDERFAFIAKWKKDHRELLMEQLGPKCVDVSFLHGIFFAPSFSQATVPELQCVVMADTCHLNYMFPVVFAIVFGNENLLSWKEFWKFIVELHPCLNKPDVNRY